MTVKKGDVWVHSDLPLDSDTIKQQVKDAQEKLNNPTTIAEMKNTFLKVTRDKDYNGLDFTSTQVNIKSEKEFRACLRSVLQILFMHNPVLTEAIAVNFFTHEAPKLVPQQPTPQGDDDARAKVN